ncbi:MAG: undecaprenyldiphospho-muramoylpentapeptide beta-N-acetylglucosaminyltransferase [Chromatiales bacterium]|jgi:UDP-N-acetylglucosamine--N-acetylmuramyl-(pentapeptide) pyrophosphoryl-undecaprenol N-acetylglucosamine transferase
MGARVMVMAGGTGGHVFPALAVADRLRTLGAEVFWLGTRHGLEARVVPGAGYEIEWIEIRGLRGKGPTGWLLAPFRLARSMLKAAAVVRRRRPQVVLGVGGFVAGPGGVVSRLMGLPLVIHEQNTVPGMTNRWLSRIATRVLEAFPGTFPAGRGALETGNPVRADIAAMPPPAERFRDRAAGPRHLLVLGGSQGARALNEAVPHALARLPAARRPLVRHQAGRDKAEATAAIYLEAGVEAQVSAFEEDMAGAYAWADLVICRAGALTIAELAAAGLGAVLVPFPHAVDDHQTRNGRFLTEAGAAELLPEDRLDSAALAERVGALLGAPERLLEMAEAARRLARPAAADAVARTCLEVAR